MALSKIPSAGFQDNVKFRNIIINGDMSIAQRSTSKTGITGAGYHTIDRWHTYILNCGTYTFSQSTDVPSGEGFSNSFKIDCTTADASPASADQFYLRQKLEAQFLQYLCYGTSNAKKLTLSFWVKCNKATTASVQLAGHDFSKMVTKSYTINTADTWEKKIITFNGNTSDSFNNDNGVGMDLRWWLDSGSDFTSGTPSGDWEANDNTKRNNNNLGLASSTDNEFYLCGVQLEAGEVASDFEFLPHDVNLQRCQRYYEVLAEGDGNDFCTAACYDSTLAFGGVIWKTTKRSAPSLDQVSGTEYYRLFNNGSADNFDSFTLNQVSIHSGRLVNADSIAVTQGHAGWFGTRNANCFVALDAEL